ncbi:hypothetical protein [Deinococcus budaensis]|uniref:Uncharacterized protein n=1 Tax=Deinococcus budaensis TaxID=1665626 RepID=A0A7W8GEP3_9DEIO|nr:hypothetical protein [Deinococcus budaensis]MBB5234160.1 hypothetical protein [Deinococcus budaensis]
MTERNPFFNAVDEVLAALQAHAAQPHPTLRGRPFQERRAESVEHLAVTAGVWEDLIAKLLPCDRAALIYVAQLCRAHGGLVARRVVAALGSSRGNGLVGILLSALALATTWNVVRGWLPAIPSWVFVALFICSMYGVLYAGSGLISGGHATSRLLYYADALDAAVQLQGALDSQGQSSEAVGAS